MRQDEQQDFLNMSDDQAIRTARRIVLTSSSEEEVKRRLEEEMHYTDEVLINTCHVSASSGMGVHAHSPFGSLGGLTLTDGTMITVIIHGHQKPTILL